MRKVCAAQEPSASERFVWLAGLAGLALALCVSMKSDLQLKQDVEQQLRVDPRLNSAHIGVTVNQGAVTLFGAVDSYAEKWAAEETTKQVGGVRTVAHDLTVQLGSAHARSDTELAVAVEHALEWDVYVPAGVKASVENGAVRLTGLVSWNFQRDAAERAVRNLTGIVAVLNSIELTPHASPDQVKDAVQAALDRQAHGGESSILVETSGGEVTLSGHAASWQAIEDARLAAWSAPGVTSVIQKLRCQ